MYTLLEFRDVALATCLSAALRRLGVDSNVFNVGLDLDGNAVLSTACLNASELEQVRHLIYAAAILWEANTQKLPANCVRSTDRIRSYLQSIQIHAQLLCYLSAPWQLQTWVT